MSENKKSTGQPQLFDVSRLTLEDRGENESRVHAQRLCAPTNSLQRRIHDRRVSCELAALAGHVVGARNAGRPVIVFIGGHVIKDGMGLFLSEMVRRQLITHVASNGAAAIHDWELGMIGHTSEDVRFNLHYGRFGLWKAMQQFNGHVADNAELGMGKALGEGISEQGDLRFAKASLLLTCYTNSVPFTVHATIGADINHMCATSMLSLGQASFIDFLIFANAVERMQREGGVFINIGSAVQGPEVFLKALSMARNVILHEAGGKLKSCAHAVFDMAPLPDNWHELADDESDHSYYFRPWKTILMRSRSEGSESYYIKGRHEDTISDLLRHINIISGIYEDQ